MTKKLLMRSKLEEKKNIKELIETIDIRVIEYGIPDFAIIGMKSCCFFLLHE
jgi:hypothetical protein